MTDRSSSTDEWLETILSEEGSDAAPLLEVEGFEPVCHPHALLLNAAERAVACRRCGKAFTPFAALQYLARDWQRYAANLRSIRGDLERLTALRELLRKQVQSLKAMSKRASRAAIQRPGQP